MSKIKPGKEPPDFRENDTIIPDDGIRRGDIVFFERQDSGTVIVH